MFFDNAKASLFDLPEFGDEGVIITQNTTCQIPGLLCVQPPNLDCGYAIKEDRGSYNLWRTELIDLEKDEVDDTDYLEVFCTIAVEEAEGINLYRANTQDKLLYLFNQKILDDVEARFVQQVRDRWDWEKVVANAKSNVQQDEDDDSFGQDYLGSIFNTTPSGKFYMPWSTNITPEEAAIDEVYRDALEAVAEEKGGWIENFDDGVFFAIAVDEDEQEGE